MASYRTFAATACLLASTGCSWITVARPPQGPVEKGERLTCTTSVAAPVTDTVVSAVGVVGGGAGLISGIAASTCSDATCVITLPWAVVVATAGALLLGVGVMEAFSAAYGFGETAQCRDLERAQLACVSGVEASCAFLQDRSAPAPR
jgi:hypothetical protein